MAQVEGDVERAFLQGDISKLTPYLGATLDLRILDTENVYGRSQAEVLLGKFFTEHPPKNFSIAHHKNRSDTSFFIGTYTSKDQMTFRVSVFMKTTSEKRHITQVLIQNSTAL